MQTLRQQTLQNTGEQLMLFQEVSHANLSPLQAKEKEQQTTVSSGRKCFEQYKRFNPRGSSLKTFTDLLLRNEVWYSSACALTWKMRGTKFNRLLFQLVPSAHRTAGIEFGLLPTAQTQGLKVCSAAGKTQFVNLEFLPTPNATDGKRGGQLVTSKNITRASGQTFSATLNDLAKSELLPTPIASEAKKASINAKQSNLHKTFQVSETSQLNPLYVAEMMGFPTDYTVLPFLRGDEKASKPTEMQ